MLKMTVHKIILYNKKFKILRRMLYIQMQYVKQNVSP